jgi:hypothetical protein
MPIFEIQGEALCSDHLEHLCGLRKSSSERQKVANNYRTPASLFGWRFEA